MTGQVREVGDERGFMHYECAWPKEVRCDWCYTEQYKNKAELRVEISRGVHNKLCLPCWFTLAFIHVRVPKHDYSSEEIRSPRDHRDPG